jgi:type IV fimbrial biogenesis protein FimT
MRETSRRLEGQTGWTLTELVMVVAILAVTLGIAIPSLTQTVNGMRMSTLTNSLMAELNLARAEAIRRGERVALCAAASPDACSPASGWEQGWIVFEDSNNNGLRDASEPVIRVSPAAPIGWSIRGNGPVARYVSYHPLGGTLTVSGAFQAGSITICQASAQSTPGARVVINSLGRPRSQRVDLPSCG